MRIAYLIGVFPPPAATPVLNQITGLIDRGHAVDVFADTVPAHDVQHADVERYRLLDRTRYTPKRPRGLAARAGRATALFRAAPPEERGALLHTLNPLRFSSHATTFRLFHQAVPFLGVGKYDIVQCGHGVDGRKAVRLRSLGLLHGVIVTAFRGKDLTAYVDARGKWGYRGLFREGRLFQPVCQDFAERLKRIGCPPEKIRVHPTGIDVRAFRYSPPRPPDGTLRLVSVARLVEKKGLEYAIRAVSALVARGIDVEYVIAGEGTLRPRLEQLVAELGLVERVRLPGLLLEPRVRELLEWCDALLAPSVTASNADAEGIPNVLKEALASGRPVVATPNGGISELVQDGLTGFLVPERDTDALVASIQTLHESPDLRARIAETGRARVEREYDIEALNDRLVATYDELLARRPV